MVNVLFDIRNETGVSYVLISHDLALVRQLSEHAVVLDDSLQGVGGRTGRGGKIGRSLLSPF